MKTIITIGLLLASLSSRAQSENWAVSAIPAAMLENADAVLRLDDLRYVVKSPGEATRQVRQVITILNEQAEDKARLAVYYDKFSKVVDIEGAIFDAAGKQVKRLKRAEIADRSYSDDFQDDTRFKLAEFSRQLDYPYTVEFRYEVSTRNLMFYPIWQPQDDQRLSVVRSQFHIEIPAGISLRYKESNVPNAVNRAGGSGQTNGVAYTWYLDTLRALEMEPLSPPLSEQVPTVYTAPSQFDVQDYTGRFDTWKDVGAFYYQLNKGRDVLPEAVQQQVRQLVANEKTVAGKVGSVYAYLQSQARYISIQLGIGGWQTIEASRVAQTHYGDCKALTNYTKALLKAVGVPSVEALVKAGDDAPDIRTDLPGFQFNHVFLCVPVDRDTLWLECTSQHSPLGYLGDFTGNRHVLLVTPEGGKLVKTPAYSPDNNRQQRTASVTLLPDGGATATIRTNYTGLQQEPYVGVLHGRNRDQQREWLTKTIKLPSFELTDFGFTEKKERIPVVTETLSVLSRRWASPSGSRLFLPLNPLSAIGTAPVLTKPRKLPVVLTYTQDYLDTDTITYTLPTGYTPEFALAPQLIESPFGSYSARAEVSGDKVVYVRRLRMHRGNFPATAYTDYADFRKKVAKADRAQLVLIRREVAMPAPK
ncbi:DUF3857 domain-containing protein [Fibrivirga algicola]|uniref:DUF3857 domain-containing protein n=1 Tax=Fibrivirga algicola TaxID=2950420 RepID=A0ABX0QDE5_9BACT|nr:DUF3857 domain-containing protein [Fibrivirga algicola]NID08733.1 DUF3857 domain-containing protein [Fibrivirga algicola]